MPARECGRAHFRVRVHKRYHKDGLYNSLSLLHTCISTTIIYPAMRLPAWKLKSYFPRYQFPERIDTFFIHFNSARGEQREGKN